ncbi:MAG: iron-containing alcohol dehydrogenase [Clostridiales bacterium]|uniref:iron-containing alcohol dehydrogenase family protein n=1 Tax=Clostridium sp. N3C TaxID=1776758 RepID=UPI00092DF9AE|nr:iron-containing alcohol dehydrogenase family protein [Clostridium sp. N3C]NLZ47794.1 iron-containing alcohol dehydrogenase [Clostridiales bacterium]SCN24910.1 Lactaldehyde reductase [Clostridium sp. N3C]
MMFKYSMPTELYFGRGCIEKNKNALLKLGNNALIITGKNSSKKNGSLQAMIKALDDLNIRYHLFDDVEENPSLETIEKAASLGKNLEVDFVIGIGGGSPLDASKAIAVFIKNPHINKSNIFSSDTLESLPVVAVPTTSGTGSEVTPYSIVTVHSEETKKNLGQNIFPTIAYLDSSFTYGLPYDITVNTSIDAFTHLVESYLNSNASLLSDMLAEKGFQLFKDCFTNLINKDLSEDFREKVMLASTIAGMSIAQAGTSLPHGMGYALTYYKKLPHGLANAVLTIEYLKSFKDQSKINKMLSILGLNNLQDLKDIFDSLFNVNLKLTEEEVKLYASKFAENKAKLKNHPEEVDILVIEEIYRKSLQV